MPKPNNAPVYEPRPPKRQVTIPFSEAFWDYATARYRWTKCERCNLQLLLAGLSGKQIAAYWQTGIDNIKQQLVSASRKMAVQGRQLMIATIYKLYADHWRGLGDGVPPEYSI